MDNQRHIVVAINPNASFGKGRDVGPRAVDRFRAAGFRVTPLVERNFEKLRAAALREIEGADALIVIGGDGMVNFGVNLTVNTQIPLGIVPSGTGNDMARGLGIPFDDTDTAVDIAIAALDRPLRRIDAGRVRHGKGDASFTTWFGCLLSAGFDALCNERANQMRWPKGPSRYTLALLIELLRLRPFDYHLVLDGKPHDERGVLLAVANNVSLGGGMLIAPDALVDDGQLDVVFVRPLGRYRFLRIYPEVFSGNHLRHTEVVWTKRVSSIRIEEPRVVAYADGERVGSLPIDIDVVPGALPILAPETLPPRPVQRADPKRVTA